MLVHLLAVAAPDAGPVGRELTREVPLMLEVFLRPGYEAAGGAALLPPLDRLAEVVIGGGFSTAEWKSANPGSAVVLFAGAPIWQVTVWYLDWGAGIGGFVPDFRAALNGRNIGDEPRPEDWQISEWEVGFAKLLDMFEGAGGLGSHDPTSRITPHPLPIHPVDRARDGRL